MIRFPDVVVEDLGTLVHFRLVTEDGRRFGGVVVVPEWAVMEGGFAAEHRSAAGIIEGMQTAGLHLHFRKAR